jgi:hypothetical protein
MPSRFLFLPLCALTLYAQSDAGRCSAQSHVSIPDVEITLRHAHAGGSGGTGRRNAARTLCGSRGNR